MKLLTTLDGAHREDVRFQVLHHSYGSSRSKRVATTIEDDEDIASKAPFALGIQYLDKWQYSSDAQVCCFFAADPQYINVFDLATWMALNTELMVWEAAISDTNGCIDLLHPKPARPQCELSDRNCQTISLLDRLHELSFYSCHSQG